MTLTPSALTHRLLLTLTLPVRAQSLVERVSVRTLVAAATDSGLSHQVELVLGRQLGQAGDLLLTKVATVVLDAPLQPMQPAQGGGIHIGVDLPGLA
jgi:hypothetical protein